MNTRCLALVGDPEADAYELLFSFSSTEEKDQFLELLRSNPDMGNDYSENDLLSPTTEETRDARPPDTLSAGLELRTGGLPQGFRAISA